MFSILFVDFIGKFKNNRESKVKGIERRIRKFLCINVKPKTYTEPSF